MSTTESPESPLSAAPGDDDATAASVLWDLDTLLGADGAAGVDALLDEADAIVEQLEGARGTIADLDAAGLAEVMHRFEQYQDVIGRVGSYGGLSFSEDTSDPARGALMAKVQERATAQSSKLLFLELEWVAVPDEHADALVAR